MHFLSLSFPICSVITISNTFNTVLQENIHFIVFFSQQDSSYAAVVADQAGRHPVHSRCVFVPACSKKQVMGNKKKCLKLLAGTYHAAGMFKIQTAWRRTYNNSKIPLALSKHIFKAKEYMLTPWPWIAYFLSDIRVENRYVVNTDLRLRRRSPGADASGSNTTVHWQAEFGQSWWPLCD